MDDCIGFGRCFVFGINVFVLGGALCFVQLKGGGLSNGLKV